MSEPIKIDNGKRTVEVSSNGTSTEWTYDLITVKLASERLEKVHNLRVEGSQKLLPATTEFLEAFAIELQNLGLADCTPDAAFQLHQIINAQFIAMHSAVQLQVNALLS